MSAVVIGRNEGERLVRCLRSVLSMLTDRQRDIICRRFGIGCEPETLEEIGTSYGVTRERIRQLEVKAMERLRLLLGAHIGSFEVMRCRAKEFNVPINVVVDFSNAEMIADSYDWFLANRAAATGHEAGRSHHRVASKQGALKLLKLATRVLPG